MEKTKTVLRCRSVMSRPRAAADERRRPCRNTHHHPLGWNAPYGLPEVKLSTGSATYLSRPHAGKGEELECRFDGGPTVVLIDGLEELAKLPLACYRRTSAHFRRFKRAPEGSGGVILGTQGHDRMAEDATDGATHLARGFPPPGFFDALEEMQDLGSSNLLDRALCSWCSKVLKIPTVLFGGCLGIVGAGALQHFLRDQAEGRAGGHSSADFVFPAFGGWIYAVGKQLLGFVPLGAGLCQGHGWVFSEREDIFLFKVSIAKLPELRTVRLHEEMQPVTISESVLLFLGFRILAGGIGERHG